MPDQNTKGRTSYDISIVRPQLKHDDFKMRGRDMDPARLKAIKKGLLTLHTLELMATTIYRFQITSEKNELNQQLIAAMCNEMTHYQDFTFGFGSRLLGRKALLKTGIWVESKAVQHYAELLETIDWDEDTRKVIEKDQADEDGHINRWRTLLGQTK